MSTQTVVDVIVSGSTTTVVDKRVDGVTTVAGEAPVTNVSGQVPDLGVNTDILATQGDILSLTNDVASLRANLIVTGTTLTDEIGVLSGVLISTGNQLNFTINNLSGDLIATGNSLDSLRDILSGNLSVTGQILQNQISSNDVDIARLENSTGDLQLNKFDKIGGVISGNILPDVSGSLSIGSPEFPFSGGFFKDITVSNNTLFIGDVPIHSSNGGIDFLSATGETFFKDVTIANLKVTGSETIIDVEHLAVKDNTITLNTGETGAGISLITGGLIIDRGSLTDADILFNEENDRFEFNFPVAIQGNSVITQANTGSFVTQAKLTETGNTLESQVNTVDDRVDSVVSNLGNTGITLTSSIDSLSGTTSQSFLSTGSIVDSISGNLIFTGANLQAQVNNISTNVGATGQTLQSQITSNLNNLQSVETNLITTGQTLTNKINSDLSTVSSNLATTGQSLTADILTVSGEINQPFDELSGNLVITGQTLQTQITANDTGILENHNNIDSTGLLLLANINTVSSNIVSTGSIVDDISGNLITTGQSLQADIAIVSGIATGGSAQDFRELSGNLITTGQTLQTQINSNDSDISSLAVNLITTGQTLTSLLVQTGYRVDVLSGNLNVIESNIYGEINKVSGLVTGNDQDIAVLQSATGTLKSLIDADSSNLISTGNFLNSEIAIVSGIAGGQDVVTLSGRINTLSGNLITTGQTLASDIAIVSGLTTGSSSDPALSGKVDTLSGNLITTGQTLQTQITSNDSDISTLTSNLGVTGQTLQTQITSNDSDISTLTSNLITTGQTLQTQITSNDGDISTLNTNLGTTGQTLQTQITSNDSDISTLTSNLVTTGQTLTSEIAIVSGIAENASDEALSGKVDTLSGNLITTGQTLQTQITSNDSDITSLTSNLVTTGQTLTTDITTVSGLIVDNDGDITALKTATGVLKTSTDSNAANLITTGQTLQTQITSNDGDISTLTTNLGTTGQTLQTQITSNDSDITTLTSNLITTGQTLTSDISTVSGLITDNDADITALKSATGVLKTSTNANTTNLITTGQTLQTQITSNDSDISTLTTNLGTTGQTLQTQITSNDSDITSLTSNLITTGQTLTTDINTVSGLITDNDADITALKTATGVLKTSSDNNTANLITTGQTLQTQITSNDGDITTLTSNLATTGQTLQTQITSNDGDITTLTSNLVTTGQTLTTNINTVATNLGTSGQTLQTQITSNDSDISTLTSNLGTTGQTLQTQITSNDSDIASLTTNLGTTGQTLQTQITSNDSDISTLDSTTVKLTTNQSIAGNKIFTNDVTINNLTVTGTEVVVDVENLAVKDNIIEINSGESGAGISAISGGIVIDRGTATNANILYNDANDRFELNFPLAVEGEVVASASNLITTGQTLTTNINTVSTNLGTSGQTLQTQITSNDSDISTLTTNLGTTGQTLQTQITSNDSDISTLTTNLGTTGQTLQTQITSNDSDISTLTSNLVTTGQTLQTQITSNDSDISTLTSNLVTTGQTLTTNINTVSTNLGTSGQTLQTQITSNDTDITNLSSNLVTTGQTLTTNINTVAANLVTTGQTLTSEIATVSGLIPATVIDGGGTANKVPLWSDGNTIGDSVISQSSSKIGIGTASPDRVLHVKPTSNVPAIKVGYDGTQGNGSLLEFDNGYTQKFYVGMSDTYASRDFVIAEISTGSSTDATNPKYVFNGNGDGSFYITDAADNDVKVLLNTNGNSYLNGGNIGIGTTAPGKLLELAGGGLRLPNGYSIDWNNENTRISGSHNSNKIQFDVGGVSNVLYLSNGSVGIGTASPFTNLTVYGATDSRIALVNSNTGTSASDGFVLIAEADSDVHFLNREDSDMFFSTNGTKKMTILSGGNVGIGTDNPSEKLHVDGAGYFEGGGTRDGGWHRGLEITTQNANFSSLYFGGQSTTKYSGIIWTSSTSGNTPVSRGGQIYAQPTSATNTDIRFDTNNAVGSSSPTLKMIVRGDGKVGIGTAGPATNLDVYGSSAALRISGSGGTSPQLELSSVGAVNWKLRANISSSDFRITKDSTDYLTILSGGSVGIGTNSPGRELDVDGRILSDTYGFRSDTSIRWYYFDNYSGSHFIGRGGNAYTSLYDTGTLSMVWKEGNVGIGTNAPDEKLHIEGAGNTNLLIESTNNHAQLVLKSENNTYSPYVVFKDAGADRYLIQANPSDSLLFRPQGTSTTSNWIVFNSNGSVGIGETSPDVQLHVKSSSSTFAQVRVEAAADGHDSSVAYSQAGSIKGISGYDDSTNTVAIKYGTFGGSGIDINSSGNVGIGTNAPAYLLDLYKSSGTNQDVFAVRGATSAFLVQCSDLSAANPVWNLRTFSGEDLALKPGNSEAVRIKASGNVGIGTASPNAKLSVLDTVTDNSSAEITRIKGVSSLGSTNTQLRFIAASSGGTAANRWFGLQVYDHNPTARALALQPNGGNVGIGTNSPAHKLEVSGGGGGTFGAITNRQSANANTDGIATVSYDSGNQSLRLWVDASGNRYLNAGTTAVISFTTTAVNIRKATTFSSGRATFSGTAGADGVVLAGGESTSLSSRLFFDNGTAGQAVTILNNSGGMEFRTAGTPGSSSGVVKMTLSSAGNLGIGITPTRKFHVSGSAASAYLVEFTNTHGTAGYGVVIKAGDDNNVTALSVNDKDGNEKLRVRAGGEITFANAFTFPTTDGTANQVLQTDGSGTLSWSSAGTGTISGSGTDNYIPRFNGTSALQNSSIFADDNGNVGIGTANPDTQLDLSQSVDGPLAINIHNQSTNAAADSAISFETQGATDFTIGIDRSLGTFSMCRNATLGTNEIVRIDPAGTISAPTVTIDADVQRVGIGTVAPDNPLEVFGADSGIKISSASNNRPHLRLECGTAEKLRLSANTLYGAIGDSSDTNRYMVFKDGRVGINTATPGDKLHVYGGAAIFEDNGNNINLKNTWSSGNHDINFIGGSSVGGSANNTAARIRCLATAPGGAATGSLTFTVNSGDTFVDALYIKEDGNIGIGTPTPTVGNLQLRNSSVSILALTRTNGSTTSDMGIIRFGNTDIDSNLANIIATHDGATDSAKLVFQTQATGAATADRLTIKSNGQAGFGASTLGSNNVLTISNEGNGAAYSAIALGTATTGYGNSEGYWIGMLEAGQAYVWNYENRDILFGTNNAERMRIDNGGNIGIGTNVPTHLLHVYQAGTSGNSYFEGGVHVGGSTVSLGAFLGYNSASSGTVSLTNLNNTGGANSKINLGFGAATDGSPDTTVMTLNQSGNVGIGTNVPGAKLHVRGSDGYLKFDTSGADGTIKSDYNLKLYADDNNNNSSGYQNIQFYTAGANERMRINSNGKVLINDTATTNNNNAQLYVNGPVYGSEFDLPSGGVLDWGNGDARIQEGLTTNYSLSLRNYDGSSAMVTTMFLKSGGNVGIGTVDPDGRLHVYTGSAGSTTPNTNHDDLTIESSGNAGLQLFTPDANYQYIAFGSPAGANRGYVRYGHNEEEMVLRAAAVDILKIKSTGVGIGTTPNSSAKLESYITSGGEKGLRLNSNFSGGNAVDFIPAVVGVSNAGFSIDVAGTNRFVINDGGNVGIGTNSSNAHLKVQSASGSDVLVRINTGNTETDARLMLGEADTYGMTFEYDGVSNIGYLGMNDNVQPTGSWSKRIQMSRAGTEVAFMAGNVGIGSASPGGKLHVYGGTTAFTNLSDNTDSIQITRNASVHTHQDAKLFIYDNSNADWAQKIELGTASYGLRIGGWTDYGVAVYQNTKGLIFSARTNETVINDGAADYDFRVEGDTDDYLLFTEGSTDRVAISTTAPAAKLHVEGDFKVGTTNNGNWMGYKDVSLNGTTYTTVLTINLNNHTGCYVKLFLSGDWSSHSAVAFVGEYFVQNGSDGYAEPGTVISEFDNTNSDSIESKIVDPSSDTFTIQLKLSTAANGTLAGKLSYHVMGMATAVS